MFAKKLSSARVNDGTVKDWSEIVGLDLSHSLENLHALALEPGLQILLLFALLT